MKKTILFALIFMAFISIGAASAEDNATASPIEDVEILYDDAYGEILTDKDRYDLYVYNIPDECEITEFDLYIDNETVDWHGVDAEKDTSFRHFEGYYTYNFTKSQHTMKLDFKGNTHYSPYSKTVTFNATDAIIHIPDVVTQGVYSDRNVEVFISDRVKGNIEIYADSKPYKTLAITDKKSYNYPIDDLTFGTHKIEVRVNGESKTKTIDLTYIFEAEVYGNEVVMITLPYDTTKKAEVYIDAKKYSYDPNGIPIAEAGTHYLKATYPGDSKYPKKTINMTFEIEETPMLIAPKNIYMHYKDSKNAVFTTRAITSQIKVSIPKYSTKITPKNGKVTYKIPSALTPGKYTLTAYDGDMQWARTTVTVKHIITLKAVKVKKSAKKLTLQATLKNSKPIKYKTVTFKFNGKTYKAKTNYKGIAKVTIKKSVLKKLKTGKKITYQAGYGKDIVKKTAKVLR